MGKANSKSRTAKPRSEGLSVKCVPLARHLLPSTKFKLFNKLAEQGQVKCLLKKYMRVVQRTEDAVLPSAVALGGEESIYSLGDFGLFSAVLAAYKTTEYCEPHQMTGGSV